MSTLTWFCSLDRSFPVIHRAHVSIAVLTHADAWGVRHALFPFSHAARTLSDLWHSEAQSSRIPNLTVHRLKSQPAWLCIAPLQAAFLQIPDRNPVITAGSRLYLHLDIFDRFSNPTTCTQPVLVRMSNGTTFQQLITSEAQQLLQEDSPLGTQATAMSRGLVFVADVLRAGPVMVEVCVDGGQLQGSWPRSLMVLPGKPSAAHCVVRGQSKVCTVVPSKHADTPHACLSLLHIACYPG